MANKYELISALAEKIVEQNIPDLVWKARQEVYNYMLACSYDLEIPDDFDETDGEGYSSELYGQGYEFYENMFDYIDW